MSSNVTFIIRLQKGVFWHVSLVNGWIMLKVSFTNTPDVFCCLLSESFTQSCEWVRAFVHLAQRTGAKFLDMDTSNGSISIDGRLYKYRFVKSRGYFYE